MIYGKTTKQLKSDRTPRLIDLIMGKLRFAVFPARLADGRWVWLQRYYQYHDGTTLMGDLKLVGKHRNFADRSDEHVRFMPSGNHEYDAYESTHSPDGLNQYLLPYRKPRKPPLKP